MVRYPNLQVERALWRAGYYQIAGLDEVGRGSWAGPVVAAAVIFPLENLRLARHLRGVRDSKLLTPKAREYLYPEIRSLAAAVGVGMVPQEGIDSLGIVAATQLAMARALDNLGFVPQYLLIDALPLDYGSLPHKSLVRGDNRCLSIASASIVAKVERDRLMRSLDEKYPGYGFAHNKGYGTPQHRRALHKLGLTEIHRLSFHPMRDMFEFNLSPLQR